MHRLDLLDCGLLRRAENAVPSQALSGKDVVRECAGGPVAFTAALGSSASSAHCSDVPHLAAGVALLVFLTAVRLDVTLSAAAVAEDVGGATVASLAAAATTATFATSLAALRVTFGVAFAAFVVTFATTFLACRCRLSEEQRFLRHNPAAEMAITIGDDVATLAIGVAAVASVVSCLSLLTFRRHCRMVPGEQIRAGCYS